MPARFWAATANVQAKARMTGTQRPDPVHRPRLGLDLTLYAVRAASGREAKGVIRSRRTGIEHGRVALGKSDQIALRGKGLRRRPRVPADRYACTPPRSPVPSAAYSRFTSTPRESATRVMKLKKPGGVPIRVENPRAHLSGLLRMKLLGGSSRPSFKRQTARRPDASTMAAP